MKRGKEPHLHGLIIIDKPAGRTSHDVVAHVRRRTGIRRVGHAGTLDPFATGVVVVAVGRATRVLQYVQDADKRYLAHVVLGTETDSGDVDGQVVATARPERWPDREAVEATLSDFVGVVDQVPPVYSAIKVGGQPLYRQARAGKDVDVPSREVHIHSIELLEYDPPDLVLGVHCGKGTYIRALARDIGARLGTFGYCHGLRRTTTGRFCLAQAWTLEELDDLDAVDHWRTIAIHPDFAVADLPAVILSSDEQTAWYHGQSFAVELLHQRDQPTVRVYGPEGHFAGIGLLDGEGRLKPAFVFDVVDQGDET